LKVQTGAHATRVLIEDGRAIGIEYRTRAGLATARARCEVILSGGAFGSPHLLQLSGIGPAHHLQAFGISVALDAPQVGANLADHFSTTIPFRCTGPITVNDIVNSWVRKVGAGIQYVLFKRGMLSTNGIHGGVFTRTDPTLDRPNLQINTTMWSAHLTAKGMQPHPFPGFTMNPVHLDPDGSGSVRLKSADPLADPEIRQHFLTTRRDVDAMFAGIRIVRAIARQPALAPYVVGEVSPSADAQSDAEIEAFLRAAGGPNLHPVGSCRMGIDDTCVVDPRLRVSGIAALRVADASVMPTLPAGNTNAPAIMIGEKGSAMILADAR
jgi:choline dehydrogenase